MTVLLFTAHKRWRCEDDCRGCHTCEGGLFTCVTCGASEGELPIDCPQRPMTYEERKEVLAGRLEYEKGRWRAEN